MTPTRPEGFHRGRYHRLRVGQYRILYVVDEDVITVERVDRVAVGRPGSGEPWFVVSGGGLCGMGCRLHP